MGCKGVYVTGVFAAAFAFGIGFDIGVTSFHDKWNRGVRELVTLASAEN